jgi:glycosyltransferase involved in cell wall biosynthesis
MMATPLVSVGLPVHNGERHIEASLDSLLTQTFEDFEIIISDNASTDRTPEICKAYAAQDDRIRYYRNTNNVGQTANLSRPIRLARGKYYRMHHDDDLLEPECLAACVDVLEAEPAVILCHTQTKIIDDQGEVLYAKEPVDYLLRSPRPHERLDKYLRQRFPVSPELGLMNAIFGLIRRRVLDKTPIDGPYPHADVIFCGGLTLYGAFHVVPQSLFVRRDHPGRSSRARKGMRELALWRDPGNAGRPIMPRLYGLRDLLRIIQRAPISRAEKMRCGRVVWTRYVRHFYLSMIREMGEETWGLLRRKAGEQVGGTELGERPA